MVHHGRGCLSRGRGQPGLEEQGELDREDYRKFLTDGQLAHLKQVYQSSEFAYFLSWSGAAFDLSVGFLLLFRRTRFFGMVLILIFHSTNHFLIFNDMVVPLLGILTALIFFSLEPSSALLGIGCATHPQ